MVLAMQLVFFLHLLGSVGASDVFKLVNSSVQLDVQKEHYKYDIFIWKFNKSKNIVRNIIALNKITKYQEGVEFNEKTRSLTLKNLQKNDSGLYEAEVSDATNVIVATYQLYVLDPVEKPVLNVSQKSNDSCNVTLTCETQNSFISSTCYSDHCDEKERKSGNIEFSLYIRNGLIVCNHSNPASWKNATMEMKYVKQLCPSEGGPTEHLSDNTVKISVVIIIGVLCLIVFILTFAFIFYKKFCRTTESDNTVYEEVKGGNKTQTVEMPEKHEPPGTVYCTVGPTQACCNDESTVSTANPGKKKMNPRGVNHNDSTANDTLDANQGAGNNYESVDFTTPQTIYATVNKTGKIV